MRFEVVDTDGHVFLNSSSASNELINQTVHFQQQPMSATIVNDDNQFDLGGTDHIQTVGTADHCNCSEFKEELLAQRSEISQLKNKLDAQAEVLGKIYTHTANVDKYISEVLKNEKPVDLEPEFHTFDKYSDLHQMKRMKTSEELAKFETNLDKDQFKDRFIRFLRSKYNWSNTGRFSNGDTLFTVIIRQLIDAELFLPFSWKGINRKKSETSQKLSFASVHAKFIAFMKEVIRLADKTKAESDIDGMFENLLRFKVQNYDREKKRGDKPLKLPTPRNRVPVLKEQNENDDDDDVDPSNASNASNATSSTEQTAPNANPKNDE